MPIKKKKPIKKADLVGALEFWRRVDLFFDCCAAYNLGILKGEDGRSDIDAENLQVVSAFEMGLALKPTIDAIGKEALPALAAIAIKAILAGVGGGK
jgi:hypothetical protein